MKSFKLLDRQHRRVFTTVVMLAAAVVPALSPVLVSAAQVTNRSITLSSAKPSDTGVTYKVDFDPSSTTTSGNAAVLIEFCKNSPLIGDACTAPNSPFSLSSATAPSGWTKDASSTSHAILLTGGTLTASTSPALEIAGVTNPPAGALYARIVTYDTDASGLNQTPGISSETPGDHVDDGGVAMYITDNINVDAAVLESLTFCVSGGVAPGANCDTDPGNVSGITAPSLTLGEDTAGTLALVPGTISTGTVYTQLSTNAVHGAVVNIKSANACGGLKRAESASTVCDIPAANTALTDTVAGIGVQVGDADGTTNSITGATGKLEPYTGGNYDTSSYILGYTGANTGVASTYGDPILDTNDTTANNMNNTLKFGAGITNQTPAGRYSNQYSLIATGKF